MTDLALVFRQASFNFRGGLRNARAVVFTIVMPVVFLVLFNSVFAGNNGTTRFQGATVAFSAYFTPGIIAYSIMLTGFNGLLIALTTNRERGILKRYRGTPMPPWVFLSAQIVQTVTTIALMAIAIVVIGWVAYDVHPQTGALGAFVLYLVLGSATMCALGIARDPRDDDRGLRIRHRPVRNRDPRVHLRCLHPGVEPSRLAPRRRARVPARAPRRGPPAHLLRRDRRRRHRLVQLRDPRGLGTRGPRGRVPDVPMGAAGRRLVSYGARSCRSASSTIAEVMRGSNSSMCSRTKSSVSTGYSARAPRVAVFVVQLVDQRLDGRAA